MIKVFKDFTFEAAHSLPNVPVDHKCSREHGHSYKIRITCWGEIDESTGMLIDYSEISKAFKTCIHDKLDHRRLNDVPGLENSTSENLAVWIWDRLTVLIPLFSVEVKETRTAGAIYEG